VSKRRQRITRPISDHQHFVFFTIPKAGSTTTEVTYVEPIGEQHAVPLAAWLGRWAEYAADQNNWIIDSQTEDPWSMLLHRGPHGFLAATEERPATHIHYTVSYRVHKRPEGE
jgi:ligand-binding SRPBCC domain-containing protein